MIFVIFFVKKIICPLVFNGMGDGMGGMGWCMGWGMSGGLGDRYISRERGARSFSQIYCYRILF